MRVEGMVVGSSRTRREGEEGGALGVLVAC